MKLTLEQNNIIIGVIYNKFKENTELYHLINKQKLARKIQL